MDEFLLSILNLVMTDMGVSPEIAAQVTSMGAMGLEKFHKINSVPKIVYIDNLSLAYLKSFRSEQNSTIVVSDMNALIEIILQKKPNLSASVQEILHKISAKYKIMFAEFTVMQELLQIQAAKTADNVIQTQLLKNKGTLVIE